MHTLPEIGSYVVINFGARATQTAIVAAHTKTGRVKVRAFNQTQNHWMPRTRTITKEQIIGYAVHTRGLPPLTPEVLRP